jgi:hypothetical protein
MAGLYLYCLRERQAGRPETAATGIDDCGPVFCVPYEDFEAVVSEVSVAEYGSEHIQRRAIEDLGWIKDKAVAHQAIVAEAMKGNNQFLSVIPMKFGMIFKSEVRLREVLAKDCSKIQKTLINLRCKQEWSLKVYLRDRKSFEEDVKKRNPAVKAKEDELIGLDEGMAFFMKEELEEILSREVGQELKEMGDEVFDRLKGSVCSAERGAILEREVTGKQEPMVLNAAFLVREDTLEKFKEEAGRIDRELGMKGLYLEYSGPWPPYNFASY